MANMILQTHLFKHNFTCYFRARILRDLRLYPGRSEEKSSLRTSDPVEARRLARQALVDFDARCHRLRKEVGRRQGSRETLIIDDALIACGGTGRSPRMNTTAVKDLSH